MPPVRLASLPIKHVQLFACLHMEFVGDLVDEFVYLREPTFEDTARLLSINEARGFRKLLEVLIACICYIIFLDLQ
jgi:hypothetical protein